MQVSSLCRKSPFHSYTSVEPIARWCNPPWGYPIIQQDQFIRNDRRTSSPSTSNKSCKHSHGFSHESNKSCLPSTCAASYFPVYSPGLKNTWHSGESDDPWMLGLHPKASQKSCWSWYHDVRPSWLPSLHFHSSCCWTQWHEARTKIRDESQWYGQHWYIIVDT